MCLQNNWGETFLSSHKKSSNILSMVIFRSSVVFFQTSGYVHDIFSNEPVKIKFKFILISLWNLFNHDQVHGHCKCWATNCHLHPTQWVKNGLTTVMMTYIGTALPFSGDLSLSHRVRTILTLGSFRCSFGTSLCFTSESAWRSSSKVCDGSSTDSTSFSDIPTAAISEAQEGHALQGLVVLYGLCTNFVTWSKR